MRTAHCLLDKDKITTPTGVASNVYRLVADCPFRKKKTRITLLFVYREKFQRNGA